MSEWIHRPLNSRHRNDHSNATTPDRPPACATHHQSSVLRLRGAICYIAGISAAACARPISRITHGTSRRDVDIAENAKVLRLPPTGVRTTSARTSCDGSGSPMPGGEAKFANNSRVWIVPGRGTNLPVSFIAPRPLIMIFSSPPRALLINFYFQQSQNSRRAYSFEDG